MFLQHAPSGASFLLQSGASSAARPADAAEAKRASLPMEKARCHDAVAMQDEHNICLQLHRSQLDRAR